MNFLVYFSFFCLSSCLSLKGSIFVLKHQNSIFEIFWGRPKNNKILNIPKTMNTYILGLSSTMIRQRKSMERKLRKNACFEEFRTNRIKINCKNFLPKNRRVAKRTSSLSSALKNSKFGIINEEINKMMKISVEPNFNPTGDTDMFDCGFKVILPFLC